MSKLQLVKPPPTKNSRAAEEALEAMKTARLNLDVLWASIRLHYNDRAMLDDLMFHVAEPLSYVALALNELVDDAKQESSSEP